MSITLHKGSILDSPADYIVNPANGHLRHGGGLAFIIDQAARTVPVGSWHGMSIKEIHAEQDAMQEYNDQQAAAPLIATGNCILTSAGRLPYKGIIHAVGPIWNGGDYMERDLLDLAHESTFKLADELGAKSIAVPAISCGIFGFPVKEAARIAIVIAGWATCDVEFWLFSDEHFAAYNNALERL